MIMLSTIAIPSYRVPARSSVKRLGNNPKLPQNQNVVGRMVTCTFSYAFGMTEHHKYADKSLRWIRYSYVIKWVL